MTEMNAHIIFSTLFQILVTRNIGVGLSEQIADEMTQKLGSLGYGAT